MVISILAMVIAATLFLRRDALARYGKRVKARGFGETELET